MTFDDELRSALRAEAGRYEPGDDGLTEIRSGVRAARTRRRRIQGGVVAAAAMVAALAGIGLTGGDDQTDVESGGPVATSPSPSTTEAEVEVAPVRPVESPLFPGIWPFASQAAVDNYADGDTRFEDPVATADAFARDYVGMLDPVVTLRSADGEEALVELRPKGEDGPLAPDSGPRTLAELRSYETSYGARVWTVVGATSPNVVLDEPRAGTTATSPLTVSGEATGYEGTVVAQVRQDGMRAGEHLGQAVGIAGAGPEMGPLALEVRWETTPTEPTGALLVHTDSGLSGVGVPEATVVRLAFDRGATPQGEPCATPGPSGEAAPDEMDVSFFFTCDVGSDVSFLMVPVVRRVPRSAGVLRATLEQLVTGPTAAERSAGLSSLFSSQTADVLAGVSLRDGTAVVDFARPVDNASTSAGQLAFRGALDRTVFQFGTVERIEYRLEGSCDAFWQWQQVGDCQLVNRGG